MTVKTAMKDGVLVMTIDNPPVNALGQAVRAGLAAGLDRIESDDAVRAAVIIGQGAIFSGGADIREFGKPPQKPFLPDVLNRLEKCRVPTIAAVAGPAMGGGLETALACRYRIAGPKARFALPEVNIGLIPGAGGTQRLPRLVGVRRAAEIVTTGKPVGAEDAAAMGLVDRLVEGDLLEAALVFAREIADAVPRAPLSAAPRPSDWDEGWLSDYERKCRARARGQLSPVKAFEAVRASGTLPFAEGLAKERALFLECMESEQRQALIHAFFAERQAGRHPSVEGVSPRPVETIGVLGAGTMGAGIAIACAGAGYRVRIYDAKPEALEAGMARIRKTFEDAVAKGRIAPDALAATLARVAPADAMEAMDGADLVIEAVIERMDVKKNVFAALDRIAKPGAVLATNTSYLNIDEIAAATKRPQDVLGMHFFSPANVMRLLEAVKADKTAPDALATALAVGKRLGKVCVIAGVCDGFIGNRMFKKYRHQAECLIEDGALPQEVDAAMRDFGFAMGPFAVFDLAGLDIGWHNRRREDATRDPRERYVDIADRLYEMNRLGQKTGAGWYRYEKGDRTPHPDPEVEALILEASRRKGVKRRPVAAEEIRERLVFALVNEGARIIEEGIAARPADIDLVFIHGYGFPAYRGGPMFYADQVGLERVLESVERFAREDAFAWKPSALLRRLAREGRRFASLNERP